MDVNACEKLEGLCAKILVFSSITSVICVLKLARVCYSSYFYLARNKLSHSSIVPPGFRKTAWQVQSRNNDPGTQQKEDADLRKGRVV